MSRISIAEANRLEVIEQRLINDVANKRLSHASSTKIAGVTRAQYDMIGGNYGDLISGSHELRVLRGISGLILLTPRLYGDVSLGRR